MDDEEVPEAAGEHGWMGTIAGAAYLGVAQRTLYRLIDEGLVPAYKIGRVIRVRRDELDEFIQRSRIQPGSISHLANEPKRSSEGDSAPEISSRG